MSKRSGFPGTRIAPISLTGALALFAERAAAGPDRAGAGCSCFFWPAFWPERTLIVRAKADTNSNTIRPAKFDFIATPASQLAVHRQGEQLCLKVPSSPRHVSQFCEVLSKFRNNATHFRTWPSLVSATTLDDEKPGNANLPIGVPKPWSSERSRFLRALAH